MKLNQMFMSTIQITLNYAKAALNVNN